MTKPSLGQYLTRSWFASLVLLIIALLLFVSAGRIITRRAPSNKASGKHADASYSFAIKKDKQTGCTNVNWQAEGVYSVYINNQRVGFIPDTFQAITDSGSEQACTPTVLTEVNFIDGQVWRHELRWQPKPDRLSGVLVRIFAAFGMILMAVAIQKLDWITGMAKFSYSHFPIHSRYVSLTLLMIALLLFVSVGWTVTRRTPNKVSGKHADASYSFAIKKDSLTDCTNVVWKATEVYAVFINGQRVGFIPDTFQAITDSGIEQVCAPIFLTEVNFTDGKVWRHEFRRQAKPAPLSRISVRFFAAFGMILLAIVAQKPDWIAGMAANREQLRQTAAWIVCLWILCAVIFYIFRFEGQTVIPKLQDAFTDIDRFLKANRK